MNQRRLTRAAENSSGLSCLLFPAEPAAQQSCQPSAVSELGSLGLMSARFANSYVERLFAERDMLGLYHLISVVGAEHQLPEEFWVFSRLLEWVGSTRSGVWQYYERLSADTFTRMTRALEQFGLSEIAERYRFGHSSWTGPDQAASLDEWLDAHEQQIESAAFELIAARKDDLNHET